MTYLKFDKTLMANLDESLNREYIRTNRMGAYASSTVVDCNTRKYHGLLVVPLPEISRNNHVLLSSLDLTIVQHGAEFNVAVHEYADGESSPKGHKYIRGYNVEVVPETIYRVGGVVLKKELLFCHYEHRLIMKFTLLEAHSPTILRFKPFLAFRDVKLLTRENEALDRSYEEVPGGISMCLYPAYPRLIMQFTGEEVFHADGYWYRGLAYFKEREAGYEYLEDLYVPGYFELPVTVDKPVYFTAALEETDCSNLGLQFEKERAARNKRDSFRACLVNAAKQLYYRPTEDDGYILAGYPWFGVRAREMLIALPGCTLYAGAPERFDRVIHTFMPKLTAYIHQRVLPGELLEGLGDPDIPVWTSWVLQEYARVNGMPHTRKRFGHVIATLVQYYIRNRHPNARLLDTGLLYIVGDGRPLTWMDARRDGKAVLPREGYTVELNAHWYNMLCFHRELNGLTDDADLNAVIDKAGASFRRIFINRHGYLFDYVTEGQAQDWSVRPNMIFAASLPYSPLTDEERSAVLGVVSRELRTPKGLRTLSPVSESYQPHCCGTHEERELAYYNGSARPWLLGAYFDAYLRLYRQSGVSLVHRMLIGMEEEIQLHGVGTISELFDGNPPYNGRGAISYAPSVGEILRSLSLLEEYEQRYSVNTSFDYRL